MTPILAEAVTFDTETVVFILIIFVLIPGVSLAYAVAGIGYAIGATRGKVSPQGDHWWTESASSNEQDQRRKPVRPSATVRLFIGTPIVGIAGAALGAILGGKLSGQVGFVMFAAFCLGWGILCGKWSKRKMPKAALPAPPASPPQTQPPSTQSPPTQP